MKKILIVLFCLSIGNSLYGNSEITSDVIREKTEELKNECPGPEYFTGAYEHSAGQPIKGTVEPNSCMIPCNKKCCKKVLGVPVCEPTCKMACDVSNNVCKQVQGKAIQLAQVAKDTDRAKNRSDCEIIVAAGLAAWGGSRGGAIGAMAAGASGIAASRMACRRVFP